MLDALVVHMSLLFGLVGALGMIIFALIRQ